MIDLPYNRCLQKSLICKLSLSAWSVACLSVDRLSFIVLQLPTYFEEISRFVKENHFICVLVTLKSENLLNWNIMSINHIHSVFQKMYMVRYIWNLNVNKIKFRRNFLAHRRELFGFSFTLVFFLLVIVGFVSSNGVFQSLNSIIDKQWRDIFAFFFFILSSFSAFSLF